MKRRILMKKQLSLFFIVTSLTFSIIGNVFADEVRLKNGDRLTGRIIRMEGGKLILKTIYAGEISILWQEVAGVQTEGSADVVLNDDTRLKGVAKTEKDGKMTLDTRKLETPVSFRIADVKTINPAPEKIVNITARANVNITSERGNTDSDNYYLNGEFVARTKKNRYKIGGELSQEESDNTTTSKNWLVSGNYSHFLNKKWFLFANTLFEHDEFKDLELRSTLGAGAGYQVFETPLLNLSFSAGLAGVDENFYMAEDKNYSAGQGSVNYDQYFFKKFVQLFHVTTGYISLENADDWFIKTRTGLRFPIYKGFTATLQYNYDWNNRPSTSTQTEEDTKLIFMLGYELNN
jgi:putative salt-induced outer membrane protein YdiY